MANYKSRPPASCKAARIAWDELVRRAARLEPSRIVDCWWYSVQSESWSARLNEIGRWEESPYLEMDATEVRDRKENPHSYAANDEGPRPAFRILSS